MLIFTKFINEKDRKNTSLQELSKFKYFMVIKLSDDYLKVSDKELMKIKIHAGTLDDYFVIIIKDEDPDLSEPIQALNQGFQQNIGSFIGVVFLNNVDSKTKTLKVIHEPLPTLLPTDAPERNLWQQLEKIIDYKVPLNDLKTIRSNFTIDLILKIIRTLTGFI